MASSCTNKVSATLLILSLLLYSAAACRSCEKPSTPPPSPPTVAKCPKDTLKLGVCADLLGLVNVVVSPSSSKCCALIQGLADQEAALCLCTAIKDNLLGIYMNSNVTLGLILNTCQKSVPSGFEC